MSKATNYIQFDSVFGEHATFSKYEEGSMALTVGDDSEEASIALDSDDARRLARTLSPWHTELAWTDDRSQAAHFVSKDAARACVRGCNTAAGARVVRVLT